MSDFAALVARFQQSGRLPADFLILELRAERQGIPPRSDAAARLREFAQEVAA